MKKFILIIATISLILGSCTKEAPMEQTTYTPESSDDDTTVVDNNNFNLLFTFRTQVTWSELDSIVIEQFDSTNSFNSKIVINKININRDTINGFVGFTSNNITVNDTLPNIIQGFWKLNVYLNNSTYVLNSKDKFEFGHTNLGFESGRFTYNTQTNGNVRLVGVQTF